MNKLELKHLSPYLPYGLKVTQDNENLGKLIALYYEYNLAEVQYEYGNSRTVLNSYKPVLRPLIDLKKDEFFKELFILIGGGYKTYEHFKSVQLKNYLYGVPESFSYRILNLLISMHFDVFGLIEKGLAIDINTL